MTAKDLYERDFLQWTVVNAKLLRKGRLAEADIAHIAEEIADMGVSERKELYSRVRVLLTHLLKWQAEPERRGRSWISTIHTQRAGIGDSFKFMPSLRRQVAGMALDVYPKAVRQAAIETGLPEKSFPRACPFTVKQILDEDFFPG